MVAGISRPGGAHPVPAVGTCHQLALVSPLAFVLRPQGTGHRLRGTPSPFSASFTRDFGRFYRWSCSRPSILFLSVVTILIQRGGQHVTGIA